MVGNVIETRQRHRPTKVYYVFCTKDAKYSLIYVISTNRQALVCTESEEEQKKTSRLTR